MALHRGSREGPEASYMHEAKKNLFIHALTEKIIEYIAESFFIVSNLDEIFLI